MKKVRILALVLALTMLATLFAACEKKETPGGSVSSSPSAGTTPSAAVTDEEEEIVEVNLWMPDEGNAGAFGSKWEIVNDAINAYTEENLNIHINFTWVPIADLATQFSLAMANKETIDIVVTSPYSSGSFVTYYTNGMAMDIKPYLEEHGQDIINLMSDMNILDAYTMDDGGIYGIPTYRMMNSDMYLCYRTDVLTRVGMLDFFKSMTSWSEYEQMMEAIKSEGLIYANGGQRNTAGASGFYHGIDDFTSAYAYDTLGDRTGMLYSDQDGNVSLSYTVPELIAQYARTADWFEKGYYYPDSYVTTEPIETLIAGEVVAGYFIQSEFGVEVNKSQTCQTDMTAIRVIPALLTTGSYNKFGIMVPVSAAEPAAAIKLLNAFYTETELMDLINWGVIGETYTVSNGEASYLPGTDGSTSGYHYSDFIFGNQFITTPWIGTANPATFREEALANFKSANVSRYVGITISTADLSNLVSAIVAVRDEYVPLIAGGLYDEAVYEEYLGKLQAVDIDDYVAHFQNALNDFMG